MKNKKEFESILKNEMGVMGIKKDQVIDSIENNLTPYILEERKLQVTQMDVFSRLMKDRIIWLAGEVNDRMSTTVQAQLIFLSNHDPEADITMHLDTPGGSVKSGLSIIDTMNCIPCDIQTINTGMCASMGSVLLSSGTKGKRSSLKYSDVMCHQASYGARGHVEDVRITVMEAEKKNYILSKLLAKNIGITFEEYMDAVVRDKWYNSEEALEFGIIDNILDSKGPNVSELLDGFDEYYMKKVTGK